VSVQFSYVALYALLRTSKVTSYTYSLHALAKYCPNAAAADQGTQETKSAAISPNSHFS